MRTATDRPVYWQAVDEDGKVVFENYNKSEVKTWAKENGHVIINK